MPNKSPPPGRSPAATYIAPSYDRYRSSDRNNDEEVSSNDTDHNDDSNETTQEPMSDSIEQKESVTENDVNNTETPDTVDENDSSTNDEPDRVDSVPLKFSDTGETITLDLSSGSEETTTSDDPFVDFPDIEEDSEETSETMTTEESNSDKTQNSEDTPTNTKPSETRSSGTHSEEPDVDFSDVAIDGVEEENTSNSTGEVTELTTESGSEAQEESDEDDINAFDAHSFTGDGDSEDAFSDPDASETWGTTTENTEFEQPIESASEEESNESTTNDPEEAIVVAESIEPSPADQSSGDLSSLFDDKEPEDSDGEDEPADFFGSEDVDTGFDDIDIDGAVDDPDDPDASPSFNEEQVSKSDSPTSDGAREAQTTTSNETVGGKNTQSRSENSPQQDSDPYPQTEERQLGDSQSEPPAVPPQRIRTPGEILGGPIGKLLTGGQAIGSLIFGCLLMSLRGVSIAAEWGASIFLYIYGIVVLTTLIFPASAPTHIVSSTTRFGVIAELSIVILPMILIVFMISMLIDELVFDGSRYETPPVFDRL